MPDIDGEPISDSFNARIIAEFRANHGRVGGPFEGAPMILIHHRGAKTGTERVSPALYCKLDGGWAVFASKAGAPTDPDWYHNLLAHPNVTIEVSDDTFDVVARVAEGEERARIRDAWHQTLPLIAEYEAAATTGRQIPIVIFEPAAKG
jgi:deazaflavin-dependent oxidoreductase (nitroreductase family)